MLTGGAILLLPLVLQPVCATAVRKVGAEFTNIASFGDSISDNGRALFLLKQDNISYQLDPAYYKGRFSNGPVWVENLAAAYAVPLSGYAIAGSTSNNSYIRSTLAPGAKRSSASADEQVAQFLANSSDPARQNMGATLFTIWTGTNDIQDASNAQPAEIVSTIRNMIKELRAAGGHYLNTEQGADVDSLVTGGKSFLIVDLYDLSKIPLAGRDYYLSSSYTYVGLVLDPIYSHFSAGMHAEISKLAQEAGVAYLSAYDLFRAFRSKPAKYGFEPSKTQTECLRAASSTNARSECTNPDQYVYWDDLHPTRKTHQLIAKKAKQITDQYYG